MAEFVLIEKKEESKQESSSLDMEDKLLYMKSKCLTMYDFLKHEKEMDTDLTSDARWGLAYMFEDCADLFDETIKKLICRDLDKVDKAKDSYERILGRLYPYREGNRDEHLKDLNNLVNKMLATVEKKRDDLRSLQHNIMQARHNILESERDNQIPAQER